MDEEDFRAGLRTIADRSVPPPQDAQERIRRRSARLARTRRAAVGVVAVGVAGVVVGSAFVLGLDDGSDRGPEPVVPATSTNPTPSDDGQTPPGNDQGQIVCVHPDGSVAGRIDVDRPSGAPPLTKADRDRSCDAEWPGSLSR